MDYQTVYVCHQLFQEKERWKLLTQVSDSPFQATPAPIFISVIFSF